MQPVLRPNVHDIDVVKEERHYPVCGNLKDQGEVEVGDKGDERLDREEGV